MFISLSGPPFQSWQPLKYVKSWLALNRPPAAVFNERKTFKGHAHNSAVQHASEGMQSLWKVI